MYTRVFLLISFVLEIDAILFVYFFYFFNSYFTKQYGSQMDQMLHTGIEMEIKSFLLITVFGIFLAGYSNFWQPVGSSYNPSWVGRGAPGTHWGARR